MIEHHYHHDPNHRNTHISPSHVRVSNFSPLGHYYYQHQTCPAQIKARLVLVFVRGSKDYTVPVRHWFPLTTQSSKHAAFSYHSWAPHDALGLVDSFMFGLWHHTHTHIMSVFSVRVRRGRKSPMLLTHVSPTTTRGIRWAYYSTKTKSNRQGDWEGLETNNTVWWLASEGAREYSPRLRDSCINLLVE